MRLPVLLSLFFLAASSSVGSLWAGDSDQSRIEAALKANQGKSLQERIELSSARFLGTPYVGGPLGEGAAGRYDSDPLFRTDAFDCTTYVETVLALAGSQDFDGFLSRLNHIRYLHGAVGYFTRNHFPEADWIPNNIASGYVKDITLEVAGNSPTGVSEAVIDKRAWFRNKTLADIQVPGISEQERLARLDELKSFEPGSDPQRISLAYLPFSTVREVSDRIPSGTLLNIVRVGWYLPSVGTPLIISHQGLVIRKGGTAYLRHAAVGKEVQDVPLLEYLRKFEESPTIRGIHLMRIVAP